VVSLAGERPAVRRRAERCRCARVTARLTPADTAPYGSLPWLAA
jgi:hypothetical protein